jgi:hypothetical protein
MKPVILVLAAVALLGGCKTRKIPRPDPNWMPLGGRQGRIVALDTAHIGVEGDARLLWLRSDSVDATDEDNPVLLAAERRQTLHRVRCGARTVDDVQLSPQGSSRVPGPTDILTVRRDIAFADHPFGPKVFPTACAALGVVAQIRESEKK